MGWRKVLPMKNTIIEIALVMIVIQPGFAQQYPDDDCSRTSHMRIYSNATYVEEAGDVVGIELAFSRLSDKSVSALLYVYEGAPTKDGVPLPGQFTGSTLAIEGIWVQQSRNSSGGKIAHRVPIKLYGQLDERKFVGTIQIDAVSPQAIQLQRVDAVWLCRANKKTSKIDSR